MPHPERYLRWTQHPTWTRLSQDAMAGETLGMQMFKNAVALVQKKEHRKRLKRQYETVAAMSDAN